MLEHTHVGKVHFLMGTLQEVYRDPHSYLQVSPLELGRIYFQANLHSSERLRRLLPEIRHTGTGP